MYALIRPKIENKYSKVATCLKKLNQDGVDCKRQHNEINLNHFFPVKENKQSKG